MIQALAEQSSRIEGTLGATPFALLLHRLWREQYSGTLLLRKSQLDKRIVFEDGSPVDCHSNLLHESLGPFLVSRGQLTEAQSHEGLAESVREGTPFGEVLVRKGWMQPYDLFRAMQQNMARRILDCFTWTEARWRLEDTELAVETPLKMHPAQLILTASITVMPFEVIAASLIFFDGQRFGLIPDPPLDAASLRMNTRDRRLLTLLRRAPTFEQICASGLSTEEAMRRLYAFGVLGLARFAEEESAATETPASTPVLVLAPEPAAAESEEHSEQTRRLENELLEAYLKHRSQDPFDLLGVKESASAPEIKAAYLALAEKLRPAAFTGPLASVADKAEELFLAAARAYAQLADYESRNLAVERRRKRKEEETRKKGSAGADFRIRTKLLDATEQFRKGMQLLEKGEWEGAINYLQFACDCDPAQASYRAHLGWARYRFQPAAPARALKELAEAIRIDPRCDEAFFFEGSIRQAQGDFLGAEECFKKAIKARPEEKRYTEALKQVTLARRK